VKRKRSLEFTTITIKFICWHLGWYNISGFCHNKLFSHSLLSCYLSCFSFERAIVSCRSKHKWEDICAFRVFPYKFQTSLQFFDLIDDYIQAEIKKSPLQSTCTVLPLYEVLFNISLIMLTHFVLTHLISPTFKRQTCFTCYCAFTCFIFFLLRSIEVPYVLSMNDVELLIFPFCLSSQGVANLFHIILVYSEICACRIVV